MSYSLAEYPRSSCPCSMMVVDLFRKLPAHPLVLTKYRLQLALSYARVEWLLAQTSWSRPSTWRFSVLSSGLLIHQRLPPIEHRHGSLCMVCAVDDFHHYAVECQCPQPDSQSLLRPCFYNAVDIHPSTKN